MNHSEQIENQLIEILDNLYHEADPRLKRYSEDKVFIRMPKFLFTFYRGAIHKRWGILNPAMDQKGWNYMGIPMEINHELSIVMFHEDYPEFREDWMKIEFLLHDPLEIQKDHYMEFRFSIAKYLKL